MTPSLSPRQTLRAAVLLAVSLSASLAGHAQQVWTLSDCIDYAIRNNISLRQQELTVENNRLDLQTTRYSRLPDLSAGVSQGFGFGRSVDRYGQTVDRTSANTSLSVSTSMPLFTGFRIPNQVKAGQLSLQAATATLDKARQDISVQVAVGYLNALYYRGLADVARQQLDLDRRQLEVAQTLVEAGKKPESERATAEAQVALSEHSLTQAEAGELLARLDLAQMLNLTDGAALRLAEPDTTTLTGDIPLPEAVFAQAAGVHPSILSARYQLEASKRRLDVSRSYLMPQLSLSASYSNSYYHTYHEENVAFRRQLDLNGSEYIGLSLQIPIFNRFSTRNAVRQARLGIESGQVELVRARQTLQKEIEQAYWNAATARRSHASASKAAGAAGLAYQYEADRYEAGKSTALDLQSARTKMIKAQQDAMQAKYEYLMRLKILEFYNGVPM